MVAQSKMTRVELSTLESFHMTAFRKMVNNLNHRDMPEIVTGTWSIKNTTYSGRDQLSKMFAALNSDQQLPVISIRSAKTKHQYGRLYSKGGLSLQCVGRAVRHTLCHGLYADIDAANCQFELLRQYLDRTGGAPPHKLLVDYCSNRTEWLQRLMDATGYNRDAAKEVITSSLFGGSKLYKAAATLATSRHTPLAPALVQFMHEIKGYHSYFESVKDTIPEFVDSDDSHSCIGSRIMCARLCHIESLCLLAGRQFCSNRGLDMSRWVYVYDGCMLLLSELDRCDYLTDDGTVSQDFLTGFEDHIHQATGYRLEFIEKPMDEVIDLSMFEEFPPVAAHGIACVADLIVECGKEQKTYAQICEHFNKFVYQERTTNMFVETILDGSQVRYNTRDALLTFAKLKIKKLVRSGRDMVEKDVSFMSEWIEDPKQGFIDQAVFIPPGSDITVARTDLNTWKGTAAELMKRRGVLPTADGEMMFREHILGLMGDNEEAATYLEMWIAQLLQQPGFKTCIVPILVGPQGCGKSTLADNMMRTLIGEDMFKYTCQAKRDLFGQFSEMRHNNIYINIDEVANGGLHAEADMLKGMVSAKTYQHEPKFERAKTVYDYNHYIITTNNADGGMKPEEGDNRRPVWLNCSDKFCKDKAYFDSIFEWMGCEGNVVATYEYLMSLDVQGFNFAKKPEVEAMMENTFKAMPTAIKFLVCSLGAANPEMTQAKGNVARISVAEFREKANDWVNACIATDKVVGLKHIGPRDIAKGLKLLIEGGGVTYHKQGGTYRLTFDWDKTAVCLAEFVDMNDMY